MTARVPTVLFAPLLALGPVAAADEWDDPKSPESLGMRSEWFAEGFASPLARPNPAPSIAQAAPAPSWNGDDSQFNPSGPDKARAGTGKLTSDAIKNAIHPHLGEVKFCFTREHRYPELTGRVIVKFTIGEAGAVTASEMESSTVDDAKVEQCVVSAVRRWSFPAPRGGSVTVSYPFKIVALQ